MAEPCHKAKAASGHGGGFRTKGKRRMARGDASKRTTKIGEALTPNLNSFKQPRQLEEEERKLRNDALSAFLLIKDS